MEQWKNTCNLNGWGPPANFACKEFEGFPFAEVAKTEKLGKFFDFYAAPADIPTSGSKRRAKDTRGAQMPKEDDRGFVTVEGKAVTKTKKKGATYTRKQPTAQM